MRDWPCVVFLIMVLDLNGKVSTCAATAGTSLILLLLLLSTASLFEFNAGLIAA